MSSWNGRQVCLWMPRPWSNIRHFGFQTRLDGRKHWTKKLCILKVAYAFVLLIPGKIKERKIFTTIVACVIITGRCATVIIQFSCPSSLVSSTKWRLRGKGLWLVIFRTNIYTSFQGPRFLRSAPNVWVSVQYWEIIPFVLVGYTILLNTGSLENAVQDFLLA